MKEIIYMIKGILSEASDEELTSYNEGYLMVKESLALEEDEDKLIMKAMGVLVAATEAGIFDE